MIYTFCFHRYQRCHVRTRSKGHHSTDFVQGTEEHDSILGYVIKYWFHESKESIFEANKTDTLALVIAMAILLRIHLIWLAFTFDFREKIFLSHSSCF